MRHFVKVAASFALSASAALGGCVAPADDPETGGEPEEATLADCAPGATAPVYPAPTYSGPTYGAPRYTAPVYEAPCYGAPGYQVPSEAPVYPGPCYQAPTYEAPIYLPPITINIYLTLPCQASQEWPREP